MGKKWKKYVLETLPILISILSLLVSSAIAINANRKAAEAVRAAEEANEKAEEANQIALGVKRLYPNLRISRNTDDIVELLSIDDLKDGQIILSAINEGETFLDAVSIEIISLPGFTYSLTTNEEDFTLGSLSHFVEFDQLLNPEGIVNMDLTGLLLQLLSETTYEFQDPEGTYRATFNVVIVGRQEGDSKPSQADENIEFNRTLLAVDFIPSVVRNRVSSLGNANSQVKVQIIP